MSSCALRGLASRDDIFLDIQPDLRTLTGGGGFIIIVHNSCLPEENRASMKYEIGGEPVRLSASRMVPIIKPGVANCWLKYKLKIEPANS